MSNVIPLFKTVNTNYDPIVGDEDEIETPVSRAIIAGRKHEAQARAGLLPKQLAAKEALINLSLKDL